MIPIIETKNHDIKTRSQKANSGGISSFYQALKSVDRFDGSCKITTWLCAIAKNCLAYYRRKHPAAEEPDENLCADDSPEETALARMGQVDILKRIRAIGDETGEVMTLRLLGDLSFREIGEILSITENEALARLLSKQQDFRGERKDAAMFRWFQTDCAGWVAGEAVVFLLAALFILIDHKRQVSHR